MGGMLLFQAAGDATVALVLKWIGGGLLMLLIADLMLLVGALAVNALQEESGSQDEADQ